jgi:hypothetical protein
MEKAEEVESALESSAAAEPPVVEGSKGSAGTAARLQSDTEERGAAGDQSDEDDSSAEEEGTEQESASVNEAEDDTESSDAAAKKAKAPSDAGTPLRAAKGSLPRSRSQELLQQPERALLELGFKDTAVRHTICSRKLTRVLFTTGSLDLDGEVGASRLPHVSAVPLCATHGDFLAECSVLQVGLQGAEG